MEEEKVTIQKPKILGRVEWGRKLGKLSKQKKIEISKPISSDEQSSGVYKNYYYYYIYVLGIGAAMIAYCVYKCKSKKCQEVPVCDPKERTFVNF